MHDIDRTQFEDDGLQDFEAEGYEPLDFEGEGEDFESGEFSEWGEGDEFGYEADGESALSDDDEMELAAELLDLTNEADYDEFFGKLVRRVKRGARRLSRRAHRFLRSAAGRRLKGVLRGVARRALPIAGSAVGGFFGGPAGAALGGRAASAAGQVFGLEMEGLSPDDQDFEVARRVVRLSSSAIADATRNADRGVPPSDAVRLAVTKAAQRHAPGLLQGRVRGGTGGGGGGRWVRRGNRIIVFGV